MDDGCAGDAEVIAVYGLLMCDILVGDLGLLEGAGQRVYVGF